MKQSSDGSGGGSHGHEYVLVRRFGYTGAEERGSRSQVSGLKG